jgi:nicotinate-nucleotide pyrophosphorylase (carboxylating)
MWDPELGDLDEIIDRALREDLAAGDVTARATVPADLVGRAELVAKGETVVCGLAVAARVFTRIDAEVQWRVLRAEGVAVPRGTVIATVEGNARALLAAERTALNLVQRMCGIAWTVRQYVSAAAGRCRVTDTRKTMPGLRSLDRYAVRCGGGHNHRNDLGSGVLIKENHIRCAGSIAAAIVAARGHAPHGMRIECEVTNLVEVDQALSAGADVILLDNMDDEMVAQSVARIAGRALTEVSGNVDLDRVARVAGLGIDLVSVGALTHSVRAADVSLLFESRA